MEKRIKFIHERTDTRVSLPFTNDGVIPIGRVLSSIKCVPSDFFNTCVSCYHGTVWMVGNQVYYVDNSRLGTWYRHLAYNPESRILDSVNVGQGNSHDAGKKYAAFLRELKKRVRNEPAELGADFENKTIILMEGAELSFGEPDNWYKIEYPK